MVDSPIDFYHSRIPKKQRKKTIVEELLADAQFRRYATDDPVQYWAGLVTAALVGSVLISAHTNLKRTTN